MGARFVPHTFAVGGLDVEHIPAGRDVAVVRGAPAAGVYPVRVVPFQLVLEPDFSDARKLTPL